MSEKDGQRYTLLPVDESLDTYHVNHHTPKSRLWKTTSLISLLINLSLVSWMVCTYWPAKESRLFRGILHDTALTSRIYTHYSNFSSHEGINPPDLASRWDSMIDDHGIVAVDHNWAKQNHLPPARDLPSDPSKGMYLVDAYHGIHCLRLIRHAFYQLQDKNDNGIFEKTPPHYSHCFDHLKQTITCTVPDGLFAIHHHPELQATGDWDKRQCRDWGVLQKWTSEHTPCIGDFHKNDIFPHNLCHGSDDLIRLSDQWIVESEAPKWTEATGY